MVICAHGPYGALSMVSANSCALRLQTAWGVPAVATGGAMALNSLHRVMLSVLAVPILVSAAVGGPPRRCSAIACGDVRLHASVSRMLHEECNTLLCLAVPECLFQCG